LFDNDFSRSTPEKELFECPLDFTDAQTMCDDLVEISTMFPQALQICWQFVIPEVLTSNDAPLWCDDVRRNLERDSFTVTNANQRTTLSQRIYIYTKRTRRRATFDDPGTLKSVVGAWHGQPRYGVRSSP